MKLHFLLILEHCEKAKLNLSFYSGHARNIHRSCIAKTSLVKLKIPSRTHTAGQKIKESPGRKNSWNLIYHFFSWNCISVSFKPFPSSKLIFGHFRNRKKWNLAKKIFFMKLICLISRVFLVWTFFNFLARCALINF